MPPYPPAQAIAVAAGANKASGHTTGMRLLSFSSTPLTGFRRTATPMARFAVSRANALLFSTKPSPPVSTLSASTLSSRPFSLSRSSSLPPTSSLLSTSRTLPPFTTSTVARPPAASRYSTTTRSYPRLLKSTLPILSRITGRHSHPPTSPFHSDIQLRASFSAAAIQPTSNMEKHAQAQVQHASLKNPERFWGEFASHLHWDQPYSKVLTHKPMAPPTDAYHWFKDGKLNTCYNAIDRHVLSGRGKQVAIYYDSPLNNEKRQLTYQELLDQVQTCAGVIASHGVKKGDMVLIY
ncbi:hypothetical protein BGZ95_000424, partial [Linnemannia exigua]